MLTPTLMGKRVSVSPDTGYRKCDGVVTAVGEWVTVEFVFPVPNHYCNREPITEAAVTLGEAVAGLR